MGWKDGKLPPRNSSEGRMLEKMVFNTPFLKKMRAKSHGEKYTEMQSAGFGDNYDQIDWSKRDDSPKNYRVKINGRYVDEEQSDNKGSDT